MLYSWLSFFINFLDKDSSVQTIHTLCHALACSVYQYTHLPDGGVQSVSYTNTDTNSIIKQSKHNSGQHGRHFVVLAWIVLRVSYSWSALMINMLIHTSIQMYCRINAAFTEVSSNLRPVLVLAQTIHVVTFIYNRYESSNVCKRVVSIVKISTRRCMTQ